MKAPTLAGPHVLRVTSDEEPEPFSPAGPGPATPRLTDVLVAAPGVAPYVLVHADHGNAIEAGRVIDQQALALSQNRVVGGMPGHAQPSSDACDREVIDHQRFQCPADPAAGELRPLRGDGRGVLAPAVPAVIAPVSADPHQQRCGTVPERGMRQRPRDRSPRGRTCSTSPAPRIFVGEATFQHCPRGSEVLADHGQAELIHTSEGRQVRGVEGSVGHVEVFRMASVGTSIIGRPRRLSRHQRASPTHRSYPLTCEEPGMIVSTVHTVHNSGDTFSTRHPVEYTDAVSRCRCRRVPGSPSCRSGPGGRCCR